MSLTLIALVFSFTTIASYSVQGTENITLRPLGVDSSDDTSESKEYLFKKPPPPANKIVSSDEKRKERLAAMSQWKPNSRTRIWEYSGMFQSDIALPDVKLGKGFFFVKRSVTWPGGVVPYYIENYHFNNQQVEHIHKAMKYITRNSCIQFRPYKENDEDFIWIKGEEGIGCSSFVGRQDGGQELNLSADLCTTQETILHELMHVLGFGHQHNVHYRDKYVKILWENIQPGVEENFAKDPTHQNTDFLIGYDFNSIMHYSAYAFSVNGLPTIRSTVQKTKHRKRNGLSKRDKRKLRKMYHCKH